MNKHLSEDDLATPKVTTVTTPFGCPFSAFNVPGGSI